MIVALILVVLIAMNALYVAAEFAAVSVRRSRIHQEAESGNRLARRLLPIVDDGHLLDRFVATCQIGITISSLVLGAYGQTALSPLIAPAFASLGGMPDLAAQSAAVLTVLVFLTATQMILGELVPKSLALQFPTAIALYTVIPLQWSMRILSKAIDFLNGSGLALLRLMGVQPSGHVHIHTANEIEYLIAESRDGGLLGSDQQERLHEALRLGVTRVTEVMAPRIDVVGIADGASPEEIVRHVAEHPYTRFPVFREDLDHVLGYVHAQDVARFALDGGAPPRVRRIVAIPESASLERALQVLRTERQHIAIVVDEYGGTAGLITVGDILEDIFGGVADEFKPADEEPHELPDGRHLLSGYMRLSEAAEYLELDLTATAVTVGGFIIERLGRLPEPGDVLEVDGGTMTIEAMDGRRVGTVLVQLHPRDEVDGGADD